MDENNFMYFVAGKCERTQHYVWNYGILRFEKVGVLHMIFTTLASVVVPLHLVFHARKFANILHIILAVFYLSRNDVQLVQS